MRTGKSDGAPHRPVLYKEIIHALNPSGSAYYVDGTLGAGGHAWGILDASRPDGKLLGLDVDPQAIALAAGRLAEFGERVVLRRASYTTMGEQLEAIHWPPVQGILLDLGVSSMQLDTAERGFSFSIDAPLDMRFDPSNPIKASDLVNSWTEKELATVLYKYGEESQGARIARAIVLSRPLRTTRELAEVVARATGGQHRPRGHNTPRLHPATRTFQALRIAVNGELDAIESALPQAVKALVPGGRLAVISFHSLEDRIVKQYFRLESRDCICPPRRPVCTCGHVATVVEVNRRPIMASEEEIVTNPRARSARLRIVERIGEDQKAGT